MAIRMPSCLRGSCIRSVIAWTSVCRAEEQPPDSPAEKVQADEEPLPLQEEQLAAGHVTAKVLVAYEPDADTDTGIPIHPGGASHHPSSAWDSARACSVLLRTEKHGWCLAFRGVSSDERLAAWHGADMVVIVDDSNDEWYQGYVVDANGAIQV